MLSTAAGSGTNMAAASPQPALDPALALELPDDVDFQLGQFKHLLAELQKALLAAKSAVPTPADLAAIPEPLERARLCLCLAKAVNSLHHIYVRAYGRDPFAPSTAGGVSVGRQELDRIRQYDQKVARAVQDASRPVLSLDVAAASRFIDAAIPNLSEQQRRDLRRAAQAADARRGTADRRKAKKARQQLSQPQQRPVVHEEPSEDSAEEEEDEVEGEGGVDSAREGGGEEDAHEDGVAQKDGKKEKGGGGESGGGGKATKAAAPAAAAAAGGPVEAQTAAEQFLTALASAGGPWGPPTA